MSAPGFQRRIHPQRLLWPLVGLFLLSAALQGAALVTVLRIEASLEVSRQQLEVAQSQQALAEKFETATYLAVVGLATADWEMLLRQRAMIQTLAEKFTAMNTTLLQGGQVRTDDGEVTLAGIQDPEIHAALDPIPGLWSQVYTSHVRVLRSENRSLKQNPDLEQLRAASRKLNEALAHATALIQRHTQEEMSRLGRLERVIPVGAFLLTLVLFAFVVGWLLVPFTAATEELARSEGELRQARNELEQRVAERTAQLAQANEALRQAHDGLELRVKERTQELKEAQRHAVELARQAGMAELATNVLHNVGNVLNSVNTASSLLGERLRALRVGPLMKLAGMLEERRGDLATFLTADERGRHVPEFLGTLGEHLSGERDALLGMAAALQSHVEHIRVIVELQQSYATTASLIEAVSLEELAEDALRISGGALARHGVTIERQTTPLPRLMLDKHKLLQILLNLISNAKYALADTPLGERRLTLKIEQPAQGRVCLWVTDNGMGIAPELLTKIFQHGFTTRKEGHGFGLHSCALAAQALGGSLSARSEGPGKGATFVLEIPYRPAAEPGQPER
jgi:two-component system NtrC family sensor kinase